MSAVWQYGPRPPAPQGHEGGPEEKPSHVRPRGEDLRVLGAQTFGSDVRVDPMFFAQGRSESWAKLGALIGIPVKKVGPGRAVRAGAVGRALI